MKKHSLLIILVGLIVGFVSAHSIFEHSYTAIFFWGAVGLITGTLISSDKVKNIGLLYGFFLMASFLLFGYQGTRGNLPKFIILALVFSIISSLCGWLSVFMGFKVKEALNSHK